jgi:hypothetical protein
MKSGEFSLRDIIAPVRGMGRTAKLQNFWLSVFARYDICTPDDLVKKADRLWKMRNVSDRTIAAIVMSAGRFGLMVPPHPNCAKNGRANLIPSNSPELKRRVKQEQRKTYSLRQRIVMAARPRLKMTNQQKATSKLWEELNHD